MSFAMISALHLMSDYDDLIKGAPRLLGLSVGEVLDSAILAKEVLKDKLKIKDTSPEVVLELTRLILDRESELFAREQMDEAYEEDYDEEEDDEVLAVVLEGARS